MFPITLILECRAPNVTGGGHHKTVVLNFLTYGLNEFCRLLDPENQLKLSKYKTKVCNLIAYKYKQINNKLAAVFFKSTR